MMITRHFMTTVLLSLLPVMAAGQQMLEVEVIKVVDGDTIKVRRKGERNLQTVRLIGLDAPECSSREREGQEPFGTMAQQYLSVAITRKIVRIETDVQKENEAGELLGYVWLDDRLMNEEMLKQGLAMLATEPPNIKYVERFQKAQRAARESGRGIWNEKTPLTMSPAEFRAQKRERSAEQAKRESELEIPDYEEGCVIGNRKTRKYHVPGGRYYEQAKTSKHRVFFKNEADAQKAGYVKSAR
ncbi:MAG: thermonuclease family protein [Acidobacteriota bacterium]|nr:thermonuclease family protein [Blastocatellia bacterium]MDW8413047.1 thermonuclease family protein [Acidobacteriota bacterium]